MKFLFHKTSNRGSYKIIEINNLEELLSLTKNTEIIISQISNYDKEKYPDIEYVIEDYNDYRE